MARSTYWVTVLACTEIVCGCTMAYAEPLFFDCQGTVQSWRSHEKEREKPQDVNIENVIAIPSAPPPGMANAMKLGPVAALALGHGAGGGVSAPDLSAATRAANSLHVTVALIEQPYRVAGRRSPAAAAQLDASWIAVLAQLGRSALNGLPLIAGGRSAGARVACRTADTVGAVAVLCLAFPVHPPGRAEDPSKSRLGELDAVEVPVLVVQGDRDPFGMPPPAPNRTVASGRGDHALRSTGAVEAAVDSVIASGVMTPELGGGAGTGEVGAAVMAALEAAPTAAAATA